MQIDDKAVIARFIALSMLYLLPARIRVDERDRFVIECPVPGSSSSSVGSICAVRGDGTAPPP